MFATRIFAACWSVCWHRSYQFVDRHCWTTHTIIEMENARYVAWINWSWFCLFVKRIFVVICSVLCKLIWGKVYANKDYDELSSVTTLSHCTYYRCIIWPQIAEPVKQNWKNTLCRKENYLNKMGKERAIQNVVLVKKRERERKKNDSIVKCRQCVTC